MTAGSVTSLCSRRWKHGLTGRLTVPMQVVCHGLQCGADCAFHCDGACRFFMTAKKQPRKLRRSPVAGLFQRCDPCLSAEWNAIWLHSFHAKGEDAE